MNDISVILPKILARGLLALREQAIMPRLVNSDFSTEAAKKGDVINVPIPSAVAVIEVNPGPVPPTPADTVVKAVNIPLDQWFQNDPIHLTDKELVEIDRGEHFLPMQMSEAIRSLANKVNENIHSRYRQFDRGVFGFTGAEGVTPFASGVTDATNSRKILNQQLTPRTNRRGVLDFDAEASALALKEFSDAEKIGSVDVKIEGEIGRKYGIDWAADDAVTTHVAGTIIADATREATMNGGVSGGLDVISIDKGGQANLVGTLVIGDIIVIPSQGVGKTFVVVGNTGSGQFTGTTAEDGKYTAAGDAITGLKIFPNLINDTVDDEVIEIKETHKVNLIFHRDAFAYATRPLVASTIDLSLGSQIMSMQDPQTGIVLRLEISRQHKQTAWEFDILWGSALVRPELAIRLAG